MKLHDDSHSRMTTVKHICSAWKVASSWETARVRRGGVVSRRLSPRLFNYIFFGLKKHDSDPHDLHFGLLEPCKLACGWFCGVVLGPNSKSWSWDESDVCRVKLVQVSIIASCVTYFLSYRIPRSIPRLLDLSRLCWLSRRFVIRGILPCRNGLSWSRGGYEPFSKWNDPPIPSSSLPIVSYSYKLSPGGQAPFLVVKPPSNLVKLHDPR